MLVCLCPLTAFSNVNFEHSAFSNSCLSGQPTQPVQIQRVTDGDTVVLTDNRRVRIIGLNTLELNARSREDRQWAEAAKSHLEKLIDGNSVSLITGIETFDQHGRTLGHLVLENGQSVAQNLVSEGLAAAVSVAPNHRCAYLLLKLENEARFKNRGIWQDPGIWYTTYSRIPARARGFQVVKSRVSRVTEKNQQIHVLLNNGLEIRMPVDWEFSDTTNHYYKNLPGKKVEVRGWLSSSTRKPRLHLSHPINLRIINH